MSAPTRSRGAFEHVLESCALPPLCTAALALASYRRRLRKLPGVVAVGGWRLASVRARRVVQACPVCSEPSPDGVRVNAMLVVTGCDRCPPAAAREAIRLAQFAPVDLERLAPGFVRVVRLCRAGMVENNTLGLTLDRGAVLLVMRVHDRGVFLWPECQTSFDDAAEFSWPWTELNGLVLTIACGLTRREVDHWKTHAAPRRAADEFGGDQL